jgi:hypothetical protein
MVSGRFRTEAPTPPALPPPRPVLSEVAVTSNHSLVSELSSTLSTHRNTALSPDAEDSSSYRTTGLARKLRLPHAKTAPGTKYEVREAAKRR